jgi:hypothetical protein
MGKGDARANLHATRTQINNARTSAQTRAFKARQIAKQKRAAEERKLREIQAKAEKAAKAAAAKATTTDDGASTKADEAEPEPK